MWSYCEHTHTYVFLCAHRITHVPTKTYRKQHVCLVLVHGIGIGDGVGVLDGTFTLSYTRTHKEQHEQDSPSLHIHK